MCRLAAAGGRGGGPVFAAPRLFAAARRMAQGATNLHERPDLVHDAGWGAAWWLPGAGWRTTQSTAPLADDPIARHLAHHLDLFHPLVCLIHSRNSSFNGLQGPEFLHPQFRHSPNGERWGVMHNGSLPGLRGILGNQAAHFDTADYAQLAARMLGAEGRIGPMLDALEQLGQGWTAANAFVFGQRSLFVVNHFPASTPHPRFYTMHTASSASGRYFTSEPCHELAMSWTPLGRRVAIEIDLVSVAQGVSHGSRCRTIRLNSLESRSRDTHDFSDRRR